MTVLYIYPILMTIIGGLAYHLSSKAIPEQNPLVALSVAYTLQAIICVVLMFGTTSGQKINFVWNNWILGLVFGSIMLELGFILALSWLTGRGGSCLTLISHLLLWLP